MWIPRTVLKSLYYYYFFFFLVFFLLYVFVPIFYPAALRTCSRAPLSAAHPTATVEYTLVVTRPLPTVFQHTTYSSRLPRHNNADKYNIVYA